MELQFYGELDLVGAAAQSYVKCRGSSKMEGISEVIVILTVIFKRQHHPGAL